MVIFEPVASMAFGQYGGADCLVADVNDDGWPETLVHDRRHLWVYRLR